MKKLLNLLKPNYCIIDLKRIGGGFISETFTVVHSRLSLPVEHYLEIMTHGHEMCQILDSIIDSKHYSQKNAYRKLLQLVQHDYTSKVLDGKPTPPGKLMAVCRVLRDTYGNEYATIEKIATTRLPYEVPMDNLFSVIPEIVVKDNGDMTAKNLVFNIWCSVEKAQEYLNKLEGSYKIVSYL